MIYNKTAIIFAIGIIAGCSSTAELAEEYTFNNKSHKVVKCATNSDKCILLAIDICSKEGGFYNSVASHSRYESSLVGGKFGTVELFEIKFTCGANQQIVPPTFPLIGEDLREKNRQIMDSWFYVPYEFKF